jgi:hypothetical protein
MKLESPIFLHQCHLLPLNRLLWEFPILRNALLVCLAIIVLAARYAKSPWRRVPLGPRGIPLLGNALELRDKAWLLGRDCKNAYRVFPLVLGPGNPISYRDYTPGDMLYLNAFGQPVVVINSLKVVTELLDRRANIYSDRPRLIVASEILCGGLFTAFMPYGDL